MNTIERIDQMNALARPGGGFAMMAIDARESMRTLLRDAGRPDADEDLAAFKTLVATTLGAVASAVLCDPLHGSAAIEVVRRLPTGLMVAADYFDEPPYGPLATTRFDPAAAAAALDGGGVAALKLYLFWRPGEDPTHRQRESRAFVDFCREAKVLSLLEGVVTVAGDDPAFDEALVRAAEEFGSFEPDIYKTQVPSFGRTDDAAVEAVSARLTDAVGVPWVALSNGVAPERFPSAVGAVCRGGASGFLAGRGIWKPALISPDPHSELLTGGRDRLHALIAQVDEFAHPWFVRR